MLDQIPKIGDKMEMVEEAIASQGQENVNQINMNAGPLPPRTPNYGKTPKYITKYKEEAKLKEEQKLEQKAAK